MAGDELKRTHLIAVLPEGGSLLSWKQSGVLEKEITPYHRLRRHMGSVTLVTHGGRKDAAIARDLRGIDVIANTACLPLFLYRRRIANRISAFPAGPCIIKSMETNAGLLAKKLAEATNSHLVVRSSYWLHDFIRRQSGEDNDKTSAQTVALERSIYEAADKILASTDVICNILRKRYHVAEDRIVLVPNAIDCDLFKPAPELPRTGQVLYVGPLERRKNLHLLLDACKQAGARLMIIGDGPMRKELSTRIKKENLRADLIGVRENADLPSYINSFEIFSLASSWESQPVALLEAMACGACIVAADSPGIRELIKDGKTGKLVELKSWAMAKAIRECLGDPRTARRMGVMARETASGQHSLEAAIESERDVYAALVEE